MRQLGRDKNEANCKALTQMRSLYNSHAHKGQESNRNYSSMTR